MVCKKTGGAVPETEGATTVGDATQGVQHRIGEQIADVPVMSFQSFHGNVFQRARWYRPPTYLSSKIWTGKCCSRETNLTGAHF